MDATDSTSFHIYYRMQGKTGISSPRDHIIKDGEALCDYGVSVPDEDALKPVSEVSDSEWAVFLGQYSNLCDECAKALDYYDVVPSDLPKSPEFSCPTCDETADSVDFSFDIALIHHESNGSHFSSSFETHNIPRERYDMWRTNPEEPYSYPKLKKFIENYPQVFRPEEYHQAKREAQLQEME
ncbi:hypothetical protein [Haloarcula salinisoli]|uniref:Uncharacterized protein n=1 Tax=Haloarcula salinisoli TaxID=2487746 RepID=A0A8J7YL70_9EURY|nr:hypothetical protein [Halomicroarcula salinisoli]MBX0305356.1 hypothetical protein [Halomicroarcula salinisoli]